jgi:L-amino acid N-acyltransferase YncA
MALRLANPADAPRLAEIFAPYVNGTAITFSEKTPTALDFSAKLAEVQPDYPFLVFEEEGRVLAYAYASRHRLLPAYRWCAEVSIYADFANRARGAGSKLYTALLAILEKQGYVNLYAGITLPNPASVRIHEKFGFRLFAHFEQVGFKKGEWHDVGWWEKRLEANRRTPPAEPVPFSELLAREGASVERVLRGGGELF